MPVVVCLNSPLKTSLLLEYLHEKVALYLESVVIDIVPCDYIDAIYFGNSNFRFLFLILGAGLHFNFFGLFDCFVVIKEY